MQVLRRTDDRIDRTSLDAQRAADAVGGGDAGNLLDGRIDACRLGLPPEQPLQLVRRFRSARRAKIESFAPGDGFGVGPAPWIAALRALALRQKRVDRVHDLVRVARLLRSKGTARQREQHGEGQADAAQNQGRRHAPTPRNP